MLDLNIDISIQVFDQENIMKLLVACVTLKDNYHVVGFDIKATKSISKETCIFLSVKHTDKFLSSLNGTNHLP